MYFRHPSFPHDLHGSSGVCSSVWDVGIWDRVAIRHSELGGKGKRAHQASVFQLVNIVRFLHPSSARARASGRLNPLVRDE